MFQYNTIEEALEDLRQGRMILCTDDPDRETRATSSAQPSLPPPKT